MQTAYKIESAQSPPSPLVPSHHYPVHSTTTAPLLLPACSASGTGAGPWAETVTMKANQTENGKENGTGKDDKTTTRTQSLALRTTSLLPHHPPPPAHASLSPPPEAYAHTQY